MLLCRHFFPLLSIQEIVENELQILVVCIKPKVKWKPHFQIILLSLLGYFFCPFIILQIIIPALRASETFNYNPILHLHVPHVLLITIKGRWRRRRRRRRRGRRRRRKEEGNEEEEEGEEEEEEKKKSKPFKFHPEVRMNIDANLPCIFSSTLQCWKFFTWFCLYGISASVKIQKTYNYPPSLISPSLWLHHNYFEISWWQTCQLPELFIVNV